MPAWIWMAALGLLVVAAAVVGVRWRLAYLDRRETLFWARKNARESVAKLRENLPQKKHLASDPQLGPGLAQRVAGYDARLQRLEQRADAMPSDLPGEFNALRQQCEDWYTALSAIERVHESACYPHGYLSRMASRLGQATPPSAGAVKPKASRAKPSASASPEEQVAALRRSLDGLDQRHQSLRAQLLSDSPSAPLAPKADALYDAYRDLGSRMYPLWKQLCPAEAQAAEAEAGATFGQFLDFQKRFSEEQARDHRELAELERRERARRGDDDPHNIIDHVDRWT